MGTIPTFSITATGSANQQQWLRQCKLVVSGAGGQLDLSNLRVKFRVQSATVNTLKNAEITIYNLSPQTAQSIFSQKEFTQVSLSAGYKNGACAAIFNGTIVYMRWGRENAVTTYLTMIASDSDEAYNWATINQAISKPDTGVSPEDQFVQILKALEPYNITAGYTPFSSGYSGAQPSGKPLPRAKVLYGSVKEVLNTFASSLGCIWNIQDGLLNIFPSNSPPPMTGEITTLTPQTGLVGAPELTLDGLNVRCLLNPALKQGSLIQVPSQYITQVAYTGLQPNMTVPIAPSMSTNQVYYVYALTQFGDSWGTGPDWCSELICVASAKNAQLPVSNTYLNALPPPQVQGTNQ